MDIWPKGLQVEFEVTPGTRSLWERWKLDGANIISPSAALVRSHNQRRLLPNLNTALVSTTTKTVHGPSTQSIPPSSDLDQLDHETPVDVTLVRPLFILFQRCCKKCVTRT